MEPEALKTGAAALPHLGWILGGGGALLLGLAAAVWRFWIKPRKTEPAASAQKSLSRDSLAKLRKKFLSGVPWRYRATVDDYPTVVVLGDDVKGRPELIKHEVDWKSQQRQFLPSYIDDGLPVKFYLGPDSVVQEVSAQLIRSSDPQTLKALQVLWKDSLGWRKRVLVIIVLDAYQLAQPLPDKEREFAQLLRGKINILAELCKRPVETRICVTHMEGVEGFTQFARLMKETYVPLELKLPEAGKEEVQLQDSLKPLEKYLALGLMRFPVEDFKPLEGFFQKSRDMLTALNQFVITLRERGALSIPAPELERAYLIPGPEQPPVGAFTLVAEKKSADLRKHNRAVHLWRCAALLALGCLPVLAAYAYFYWKLEAADAAVTHFYKIVEKQQREGKEVTNEFIREESSNALEAMNQLQKAKRLWPPLRSSFQDERARVRATLVETLRRSYFKPLLERCQRHCAQCGSQIPGCPASKSTALRCPEPTKESLPYYRYEAECRPEEMLYLRAIIQSDRNHLLGAFVIDSLQEELSPRWASAAQEFDLHVANNENGYEYNWVDAIRLDEKTVGDYIVFSDQPWRPKHEDSEGWFRWPYAELTFSGQVSPWSDHFTRVNQWLERPAVDLEAWGKLHQEGRELQKLLIASQQLSRARLMLNAVNAAPVEDGAQTLTGIETTVQTLEWMKGQKDLLAAVLSLEEQMDDALRVGQDMPLAQLLTQSKGLFEPKSSALISIKVSQQQFEFNPEQVSRRLLEKLRQRSEEQTSPEPSPTQPEKDRSEFESELKPLVDDFTQRLEKANLPQEEAARSESFVLGRVTDFASGYRQGLASTYQGYQFSANRNTLLTDLSTLVQPSSPLVSMLREVSNRASIGPLEGAFYAPLRAAIEPYKPVTQLMTPDKDGNYAALGQYILLVAQLHSELSGNRPATDKAAAPKASGDKADAGGKEGEAGAAPADVAESQLPELLTPAGRVALAMLLEEDSSYLKRVDAWLDKQGILGEFRTPFRQPFLAVRNIGRDDVERVLKEQWTAERKRLLEPLLKRYPFNPESQQEIDPAELTVLRRKDGDFWVFVDQVLSPVLVERGTDWSLRGPLRNQLMLPARMLNTLNFLSRLSRTLWDGEGKPASMAMQLRPLPLPQAPSQGEFATMSYLKCGGASAFGFNQSPAWQDFQLSWWDQRAASLGVELRSPARSSKRYRTVEMPSSSWSCFRLMELGTLTDEQNMVWELPGPDGQPNTAEVLAVSFGMRGSPVALFRGVPK